MQLLHHRLSVIDPDNRASQPMQDDLDHHLIFNGEIYNYLEIRECARQKGFQLRTSSDTEAILSAYQMWGINFLSQLRGMFSIALWDERMNQLILARDRFGIKPLYYCVVKNHLHFASEMKALLPFLPDIKTDQSALAEYLTFQYTISGQTMFEGIRELPAGHYMVVRDGQISTTKYWDVKYEVSQDQSATYFEERLRELLDQSMDLHLRSDVEIGAYVSGGLDSSLIYRLASQKSLYRIRPFHGRFKDLAGYDESQYAKDALRDFGGELFVCDITSEDFVNNIGKVIYHLDQPVAGPGAFPQFMVSQLAGEYVKVVLGGQGGDEIFGGYARYLIAYFEQCIKAAIDGTYKDGNYVVTLESIVPNLGVLQEYKPLIQQFWREGLFGPLDQRFLRLIDRSSDMTDEVDWSLLDVSSVYHRFLQIFNNRANVAKEAYFDSMTHFEFKTLLPALLHVEDRMSMAHGLESRVPFLDHPLVEFVATVPADVKFRDGRLKHLLRSTFSHEVPESVMNRRDKMGFPVPLKEWFSGELRDFFHDTITSMEVKSRPGLNPVAIRKNFEASGRFSRKTWALLSLELWHQQFHDRAAEFRAMARK